MGARTTDLNVPVIVDSGDEIDVSEGLNRLTLYLSGTFTATVQMQISPATAGDNWVNEGSALTAPGTVEITKACRRVRANTTAHSSGVPVGTAVFG